MKTVYDNIVIGGSGFIGTSLLQALRAKGETVANLSREIGEPVTGVDVFPIDVTNLEELTERFPYGETVFILIGQVGAGFDAKKELLMLANIVNVLNAMRPKRVCYASSARVYGETAIPAIESDEVRPYDEYSRFKCDAEVLLQNTLNTNISLAIIRLANVYGNPRNRGFINTVMRNAAQIDSDQLVVHGDGTQSLDYIHIQDVADACIAITDGLTGRDIINLATGHNYSVTDLIEYTSRISKNPLPYTLDETRQPEVRMSAISNSKLRERYGFEPRYTFEQGLRETVLAYKKLATTESKKVLLIGGEGFIGRNIAAQVSEHAQCFSAGKEKSPWVDRKDIFIQLDPYKHKLPDTFDTVIHLIDHVVSLRDFREAERRLLQNIQIEEKTHVVLISSSVLYAQPESDYARRKALLESVYTEHCKENNIPLSILRLFNVYGPYQYPRRAGSLLANILMGYLDHHSVQIRDMNAQRDFIYVADVARIVNAIITTTTTGTFDVGTGVLTSISALIIAIERDIVHDELDIRHIGNAESFACPAAKIQVGLPVASTSLSEGLRHTFEFYLKNKEEFYD